MALIEVESLSRRFGDGPPALDGVSFAVEAGAFVVLAGANGCGKTTLLRHLNGLYRPQSGNVRVAGISGKDDPAAMRRLVGMVFQDADSQIVGETVRDDVAFGPENLGLSLPEIETRVAAALAQVGLSHLADQPPALLSGGQKRRLAIAGILAMNSRIMVFDEPFSNLDYPGVRQVLRQILSLRESGHTLILTTHDLEKVLGLADRLILMEKGRIVRDGDPLDTVKGAEAFGVREPDASRRGMALSSWLN